MRRASASSPSAPAARRSTAACAPALNSEILISNYGMLRLKLDPALYEWQFMDMNGNVLDRGLNVCH